MSKKLAICFVAVISVICILFTAPFSVSAINVIKDDNLIADPDTSNKPKINIGDYKYIYTFSDLSKLGTDKNFGESGVGAASGKIMKGEHIFTGHTFDKTLFSGYVTLGESGSVIYFGGNSGWAYNNGMLINNYGTMLSITPRANCSDTYRLDFPIVNAIRPATFGIESFENQEIKLQITAEAVNESSAKLSVWINGKLAGYADLQKAENIKKLDYGFKFNTKQGKYTSAYYIEKHNAWGKYIHFNGSNDSYVDTSKTLTSVIDESLVYQVGTPVTVPGDYIGSITLKDNTVDNDAIIIWKEFETHPDGKINLKDVIALKKYLSGIELSTVSGKLAAEKLNAASMDRMLKSIVGAATL